MTPPDDRDRPGPGSGDESPDDVELDPATLAALRAARESSRAEADLAFPAARARFTQFLQDTARPVPLAPARRGWLRPLPRFRLLATSAAAVAAVLALAFFVVPVLTNDVDSAVAQVLAPGDAVQLEAVVQSTGDAGGDQLLVESEFGEFAVRLDATTTVADNTDAAPGGELRPGDRIVVAGLVDDERRVRAASIHISERDQAPPPRLPLDRLEQLESEFDARVAAVVTSEDGATVRFVLVSGDRRLLAELPAGDVLPRFDAGASAGQDVHVRRPPANGHRPFDIQPQANATPGNVVTIRGIVRAVEGETISVATLGGEVPVALTPRSAIRLGNSGLTEDAFDAGRGAIGHTALVIGRVRPGSSEVQADIVVVGPMTRAGQLIP